VYSYILCRADGFVGVLCTWNAFETQQETFFWRREKKDKVKTHSDEWDFAIEYMHIQLLDGKYQLKHTMVDG